MTDTLTVSTNYACCRETRELGEDYSDLAEFDCEFRALFVSLSAKRRKVTSSRAKDTLRELEVLFADARHDAAFGATLLLAKDAFDEAKVVPMRRNWKPEFVR